LVPLKEGINLTIESYSHLRAEMPSIKSRNFDQPSKAYKMIGNERVANILLWRDEKQTFAIMLALIAVFYCYFTSGYTLMSALAKLLLLFVAILFMHSILPSSMFGYTNRRIPPHYFEISEERMHFATQAVSSTWNSGVTILKILSQGKDWALFLKTTVLLLFFKVIGAIPLPTLFGAGLIFMFSAFYIYEQKEEEVDDLVKASIVVLSQLKEAMLSKLPGVDYLKKK